VYLREQSREELYNKQLRQSIGNKLNMHNRNMPMFPMMDDQHSLASDTLMRPSSFRPGSASNPDFMLPKDVQFYYKQKEKIFVKLDGFYAEEKKGIEEMMDECLKSIITLFEEHKQGLFKNLDDDKETFARVYTRFSEGVDNFLKTAEMRLEDNLKAYETRIMKIQEDDQNPLGTHIEKLRLEKEMLNSKERIIQEIKQSYEKSTIPGDKQKIGELMVEEYKKKHSANLSTLAQHMQQMIGGLKNSIDGFNTFKNYASLDMVRTDADENSQDPKKETTLKKEPKLEPNPNVEMMTRLEHLMRQSGNIKNAPGLNMNPGGLTQQQQLLLQNLAQMGIPPSYMGHNDAYQMALLKAQMGLMNPQDPRLDKQNNYSNKNYNGTIPNPHINGNINIDLLQTQNKDLPKQNPQTPTNPTETSNPEGPGKPYIRPAIKSPNQKLAELKKEENQPKKMLVNKKSVTFNLTQSQNEPREDPVQAQNHEEFGVDPLRSIKERQQMLRKEKDDDINEVIRKYKQIDSVHKQENPTNERAKSPILEAKESINQFNDIYESSKNNLFNYHNKPSTKVNKPFKPPFPNAREDEMPRRQTVPYPANDHHKESNTPERSRKNTYQPYSTPGNINPINNIRDEPKHSGLKIDPFPSTLSKHKFDKNILKPKDKRQLEMDINRLGEKYGASKSKNSRPLSQNIKTVRANIRPSNKTFFIYFINCN
jgi:hypothetical protein